MSQAGSQELPGIGPQENWRNGWSGDDEQEFEFHLSPGPETPVTKPVEELVFDPEYHASAHTVSNCHQQFIPGVSKAQQVGACERKAKAASIAVVILNKWVEEQSEAFKKEQMVRHVEGKKVLLEPGWMTKYDTRNLRDLNTLYPLLYAEAVSEMVGETLKMAQFATARHAEALSLEDAMKHGDEPRLTGIKIYLRQQVVHRQVTATKPQKRKRAPPHAEFELQPIGDDDGDTRYKLFPLPNLGKARGRWASQPGKTAEDMAEEWRKKNNEEGVF